MAIGGKQEARLTVYWINGLWKYYEGKTQENGEKSSSYLPIGHLAGKPYFAVYNLLCYENKTCAHCGFGDHRAGKLSPGIYPV